MIALVGALSGACSSSGGGDGNGNGNGDGNGNGNGNGNGSGNGTSGHYACPMGKPQLLYGQTPGAKVVVDKPETWTPDNVYIVGGPVDFKATVTIQAGTVVCFTFGPAGTDGDSEPPPGAIRVNLGGGLIVNGTADKHVVFTSTDTASWWAGIDYDIDLDPQTTMRYADFYNAGFSAGGAPISSSMGEGADSPPLDLQHVTFSSTQRIGLKIWSGVTAASDITFNGYDSTTALSDLRLYPVLTVHPYRAATFSAQNFHIGAIPPTTRYVELDHASGELMVSDITLHELPDGVAWHDSGDLLMEGDSQNPSTLTFDPGAVFAMPRSATIKIGVGGDTKSNVVAVGTAALPIRFTSDAFTSGDEAAPGDWSGIHFVPRNYDAAKSKFDYVTFEYGGGMGADGVTSCASPNATWGGEIELTHPALGSSYDGPAITHSTFTQSAGNAVRFFCGDAQCLTTDYATAAMGNTFIGFTTVLALEPKSCAFPL